MSPKDQAQGRKKNDHVRSGKAVALDEIGFSRKGGDEGRKKRNLRSRSGKRRSIWKRAQREGGLSEEARDRISNKPEAERKMGGIGRTKTTRERHWRGKNATHRRETAQEMRGRRKGGRKEHLASIGVQARCW